MINGIIQIRSRIFESGLFYKAVQLLGIPQVPFGIDNTLDFFSERKKLCVRIGQYLFNASAIPENRILFSLLQIS